jgi:hypothetical protein
VARGGLSVATRDLAPAKPWTADQMKVQAWFSLPPALREPRSQRALAAQLEIHEVTISDWKKLPGWGEAVYALAFERLRGELVPVLGAQIAEAKKGSLPHAQWLFQLAGLWEPRAALTGGDGGPVRIVVERVDDRRGP